MFFLQKFLCSSTPCSLSPFPCWHLAQPCTALAGLQESRWQEGCQGIEFHCLWSAKGEADLPQAEWRADTFTTQSARGVKQQHCHLLWWILGPKAIFKVISEGHKLLSNNPINCWATTLRKGWLQRGARCGPARWLSELPLSTASHGEQECGSESRKTQTHFYLVQQLRDICHDTAA